MDDCGSLDCKKVTEEIVFLLIDNELGRELRVAYRQHVSLCPQCARKAEFTRRFVTLVRRRAQPRPAPRSLRARVLANLSRQNLVG